MSDRVTPATPTALPRIAGLVALVVGALLMLSTWDSLYDTLALPKPSPALGAQLGGIAFLALAYVLGVSAGRPPLETMAARAGAFVYGAGAVVIALWLIFRDREDLGIVTAGVVVLTGVAVIFAGLALALAAAALGRREGAE